MAGLMGEYDEFTYNLMWWSSKVIIILIELPSADIFLKERNLNSI